LALLFIPKTSGAVVVVW